MWPWSNIRALEHRVGALNANLAAAHADAVARSAEIGTLQTILTAERERYDRLLAQYTDLRREGFNPREDWTPPEPAEELPDVIVRAIRKKAGGNKQLEREQAEWARGWLDEHGDKDDAAQQCAEKIALGRDWSEFVE